VALTKAVDLQTRPTGIITQVHCTCIELYCRVCQNTWPATASTAQHQQQLSFLIFFASLSTSAI